ncbi:MAG: hypothetical protein J6T94_10550 [Bacteroidaceae bacterium]|nr:hypothetical protein [Bacteroidaceae bacterium]
MVLPKAWEMPSQEGIIFFREGIIVRDGSDYRTSLPPLIFSLYEGRRGEEKNASAQTFNAFEETFREEGADFFQKHLKNFWWFEKKRYLCSRFCSEMSRKQWTALSSIG